MNNRKELIERLRGLLPSPVECEGAADMLEADAQAVDVAYSQGFVEGERAAIVASAVPQEPVAYCVYFPTEQRQEYCQDLDDLIDDITNLAHEVTPLYAAPQPQRPRLTDAAMKGTP